LAIALRFRSDSDAARAKPPLEAPSFDSATAAGFLVSGGSGAFGSGLPSIVSPIRYSITERANRLGSRESLGLLARESEPFMVRAAMAHLNLVMIHPFSDGNGRMARCLQTLVLAREGIIDPWFSSIEEYLGANNQAYYDVLGSVGRGTWSPQNDARPWLHFCLTAHYRQARTLLKRSREMQRIWDEIEHIVTASNLPERVQLVLSDATLGYRVRNATYRSAADISETLASRDLKLLVERGLLIPDGTNRGRSYLGSQVLKDIRDRTREPRTIEGPAFSSLFLPGLEPKV
jgi:Fic/DOC family